MKTFPILLMIVLCASKSFAQSAVGAGYGLRVFPMQKHGTYNYYDYSGAGNYPKEYSVTLTPAREQAANIFFEIPTRSEKRFLHFDLNFYTTSLDFKKMTSQSWGEAGVNGSDGYYNTYTQQGTYTYSFVGLQIGTNHYGQLSSGNFSFIRGFSASINFLANQKTTNKENISTYHSSSTIYTGPYAGTYSKDSISKTTDADDIKNAPFNLKLEFLIGFSYRKSNNVFSFTTSVGVSTPSRVLSNANYNMFLCPRFTYAWTLQKKAK